MLWQSANAASIRISLEDVTAEQCHFINLVINITAKAVRKVVKIPVTFYLIIHLFRTAPVFEWKVLVLECSLHKFSKSGNFGHKTRPLTIHKQNMTPSLWERGFQFGLMPSCQSLCAILHLCIFILYLYLPINWTDSLWMQMQRCLLILNIEYRYFSELFLVTLEFILNHIKSLGTESFSMQSILISQYRYYILRRFSSFNEWIIGIIITTAASW